MATSRRVICTLTLLCAIDGGISSQAAEQTAAIPTAELADFFEKRVRPVLAANCYQCHGPKKQESGLRLDSRAAILKGGDNGPAAKPGQPDGSELVLAIRRTGDLKMPPSRKLKPADVDALTKWVRTGLYWPKDVIGQPHDSQSRPPHWAFQPVRQPAVPHVEDQDHWASSPIDRFILAKLNEAGLQPSPTADRRTLIRRATFGLTGLPPTPSEVEAFVIDAAPNAFARVVDRLLASPAYGERWGRHWLDVARYADNKGYVFFEEKKFPWAYTYRDYVIRAFNDDLPYDEFITHQLAADQLPLGDDKGPLAAMGFLTLGGRFMNNLHDVLDDRIDVVTRGLLGLTVTCARCHDHKFDPIPQADYYSLYGVFRSSVEPTLQPLFSPAPETDAFKKFDKEMSARLKKLTDFVSARHAELVASARTRANEYLLAAHARRDQPPTDDFMLLIPKGELNPSMLLRWQIFLEKSRKQHDPVWIPWHAFAEIPEDKFAEQASAVLERLKADSKSESNNAVHTNPMVLNAILSKPPQSMKDVANRYGEVLNEVDRQWQDELSRAAGAKTTDASVGASANLAIPARLDDPVQEELRQVFHGPDAPPNVPVIMGAGFLALFPDRPTQGEYKKLLKEVETWAMTGKAAPPRAMVLVDEQQLHNPRIFLRGNPNRLGQAVPRQFLSALVSQRQPFTTGSGRLDLARAIADPANPLTARVLVNRVWLQHFGSGLVRTPSDFGLRSEPPTHPELLDHLATLFVQDGWSIKRLHRRILLSAVYQQRSQDRADCAARDPENRLLWKMNRRRLDFESTRDALLAVSGDLNPSIGGPPLSMLGGNFIPRRTVYGFIDRMDLPGLLRAFDFPSPAATSPRRDTTTVAPQALYFMNNAFVAEAAARCLRRPEIAAATGTNERLARIYRLLFGREPTPDEHFAAEEFLDPQPSPARWGQLVHALLMTNEFVFVD